MKKSETTDGSQLPRMPLEELTGEQSQDLVCPLGLKALSLLERQQRYLTPPEVAERLRVSPEKVLGWIRKAELRAVNVSDRYRARYRISPDDLEDFLRRREAQAPLPRSQRRKRRPPEGGPLDPELAKKLAKEGKARLVSNTYYRVWDGVTLYF